MSRIIAQPKRIMKVLSRKPSMVVRGRIAPHKLKAAASSWMAKLNTFWADLNNMKLGKIGNKI